MKTIDFNELERQKRRPLSGPEREVFGATCVLINKRWPVILDGCGTELLDDIDRTFDALLGTVRWQKKRTIYLKMAVLGTIAKRQKLALKAKSSAA